MWCLIYTAISEHYGRLERAGTITDEELEARMLSIQKMELAEITTLYEDLFDKPAFELED